MAAHYFAEHLEMAYAFAFFLWGACTGSFLTVVVSRVPHAQSVIAPASHCPHCRRDLHLWEILPLVSWFLLGGRCRTCAAPISRRYPLIEFTCALTCAAVAYVNAGNEFDHLQNIGVLMSQLVFAVSLLAVAFIDFEHFIIPDAFSLGGLALALALGPLVPALHQWALVAFPDLPPALAGFVGAVLGAAVGGGVPWLMRIVGDFVFARQLAEARRTDPDLDSVVGWGDVKLLAFCGAALGWQEILVVMSLAVTGCAVVGVLEKFRSGSWPETGGGLSAWAHRWRTGDNSLPLGPFIALASLAVLLWRHQLIGWCMLLLHGRGAAI